MRPERFFIEFAVKHVENGQLFAEKRVRLVEDSFSVFSASVAQTCSQQSKSSVWKASQ